MILRVSSLMHTCQQNIPRLNKTISCQVSREQIFVNGSVFVARHNLRANFKIKHEQSYTCVHEVQSRHPCLILIITMKLPFSHHQRISRISSLLPEMRISARRWVDSNRREAPVDVLFSKNVQLRFFARNWRKKEIFTSVS